MLQLPAIWTRVGILQATPKMCMVWGRPYPQGLPRKGKQGVHTGLLQLQARRRREATPLQLSRL
jgi:hypothetical protein